MLYRGGHFHWFGNRSTRENTTDLTQVSDKLYLIMFYQQRLNMSGARTHIFSDNGH